MIPITKGDDIRLTVQLKRDGSAFAIASGATVRAALTTPTGIVAGPVIVLSTDPDNNWSQSVVAPLFPASQTGALPKVVSLEIEVDDNGKTTYHVDNLNAREGHIV